MPSTQPSKLLPSLFEHLDEDDRLTVLHIGTAMPETVEFFSNYRSKLYFVDLFSELPIEADEETGPSMEQQFDQFLQFPSGTMFDLCLFWDVFNFLDNAAISAFSRALRPHLQADSLAHGFGVHNLRTPQGGQVYSISQPDQLVVRSRGSSLPGYAPHNQTQLKKVLDCYSIVRSVLHSDSRLELLLRVTP